MATKRPTYKELEERNARQVAAINAYLNIYNEQVEKIAELQNELVTTRERNALQTDEIEQMKKDVQNKRDALEVYAKLYNSAFDGREQAHRALVLQVLATHEKPATQKPS